MKKIKKILILVIAVMVLMSVSSCRGSNQSTSSNENNAAVDSAASETMETEETEQRGDVESGSDTESENGEAGDSDSRLLSPEFKKTMDDYEAWFDHYCDVMKRYYDNPSDMQLMSEMSSLISEETKMLEQMENMDESEMNSAELAYYIDVTARIQKNLLELSAYME